MRVLALPKDSSNGFVDRTLFSSSPTSSCGTGPSVTVWWVMRARYVMMIFMASVLPAPLSPLMMMDWFEGVLDPLLRKAT